MVVIAGFIIVIVAVLVGFAMAGGHVGALIHPSELVTIGGASLGALIVMTPKPVLVRLIRACMQLIKGSPYGKQTYIDLFKFFYACGRLVRRDGLVALDGHISNPDGSALFLESPRINQNHHIRQFLCSALYLTVDGNADAAKLTSWLEEEVKVIEREHHAAVSALAKTADALPGFGIVAAVLGIVVSMQAISGPVDEIGHKVGAALVGTFLGILLSYGFFAPMAGRMELQGEDEANFFRVIITAVAGMTEGLTPKEVVIRASRSVGTDCRPNPEEMSLIFDERRAA